MQSSYKLISPGTRSGDAGKQHRVWNPSRTWWVPGFQLHLRALPAAPHSTQTGTYFPYMNSKHVMHTLHIQITAINYLQSVN